MKKTLFIIGGLIIAFVAVNFVLRTFQKPPEDNLPKNNPPKGAGRFIVANPLDLSEISYISKFRSCMGHDYSGKNISGERETNRSMKHYLGVQPGKQVKALSPFNGTIIDIQSEESGRDAQVWIRSDADREFAFIFFHIDLAPGITKGSKVQSNQLVGHANIQGRGDNFDMALKKFEKFGGPNIFDSPFNYMTSELLAAYGKYGITLQNIIISKEERDADPCKFGSGSEEKDRIYLQ